jgi:hypothetical protein
MSRAPNLHTALGVIAETPNSGILLAYGTTVPADASAGYATGCLFIHTDGGENTAIYVNDGSKTSSDFNAMSTTGPGAALTAALTTITPADAEGTPDYAIAGVTNTSAYGFASAQEAITVLYVIKNLQTRQAEIEARLEAAGIVAAN